jgi:hypothetical protein
LYGVITSASAAFWRHDCIVTNPLVLAALHGDLDRGPPAA